MLDKCSTTERHHQHLTLHMTSVQSGIYFLCQNIVPKEQSLLVSFKSSGYHLLFLWGELIPLDN